jgi:hypothetical protein
MEPDEEGRQRLPQQGILELNFVDDKVRQHSRLFLENVDYLVESVQKQQHAMQKGMARELRQQVPDMIRVATGASRRSDRPPPGPPQIPQLFFRLVHASSRLPATL